MGTKDDKTVVVIGNARSGTSVVTGILQIIGVDMGPDTHISGSSPTGDLEDEDFKGINTRMRQVVDKGKDNALVQREEINQKVNGSFSDKIKNEIDKKSQNKKLWGWKHTANNITIDQYLPHLKNPRLVFIFRDIEDNARSAAKTTNMDLEKALEWVRFYNNETKKVLNNVKNDLPTTQLTFQEVVGNPVQSAERLAEFIDVEINQNTKQKVKSFVIPRDEIAKEKVKAKIYNNLVIRPKRFIVKCIDKPKKIPQFLYQAVRNNFQP